MPPVIYHYTNADGIIGLIQSQKIWLSDYRSLNDRSEIDYAFEIIEGVIETYLKKNEIPDLFDWKALFRADHKGQLLLIGSFAEVADNPVLWRLYSKGKGYVVGIKTDVLENSLKEISNAQFREVTYKEDEQKVFIEKEFDKFIRELPKKDIVPKAFAHLFTRVNFLFWLYKHAAYIKHGAFENEAEWRIAVHYRGPEGIKFRSRDENIIPYFEMPIVDDDPKRRRWIKSVDLGPQLDWKKNLPQLSALLEHNGFVKDDVEFRQSMLPI